MISSEVWGEVDGGPVNLWHLTTDTAIGPMRIAVADYGATLQTFVVPDATGIATDIVLGYDTLGEYIAGDAYFGAIAGRYGNRIRNGQAAIDGTEHQLDCNEGGNHLHGGRAGFDRKLWQGTVGDDGDTLIFDLISPDRDMGFPGRLIIRVTYRLTTAGGLEIEMTARTDRPTLCNPVQHSYFNLAGEGNILAQIATFNSAFYTPVDGDLLTTGEIRAVADTPFDFRKPKPIGRDLLAATSKSDAGGAGYAGYDHNLILGHAGPDGLRDCTTVLCPSNGLGLTLRTTEPGCQFYTGGHLSPAVTGKSNRPLVLFAGFTLETQVFPCAPQFSHFPSAILCKEQTYRHVMSFQVFHEDAVVVF